MVLKKDKNLKLYYGIKEVARQFHVNESTLRYWEKEFPWLRPKTNSKNVRQYTSKDIEQIRAIHNLVKVRGFKIASARRMLTQNRTDADRSIEIISTLIDVRDSLMSLKQQLDTICM